MKKIFITLFILLACLNVAKAADYGIDDLQLRPAKQVFIPKGSFVKLTNQREFSTQFIDKGDEIVLTSTYDVFMGETKLIPQNSKFYGYVEDVKEPIQGTNGAVKIKVTKFVTPEGVPYNIEGYLAASNGEYYLGGERTPALYYARMPHYSRWHNDRYTIIGKRIGGIQYCETNTRQYGMHTVVKAGAEIIMVLQDNFDLVQ